MSALAFILAAGAVWFCFRTTSARERHSIVMWFMIGVLALGAAGILYEIFTTGRIGAPAAQWGATTRASLSR